MNNDVEFQTSTTGDHHGNFERHRSSNPYRTGIDYRSAPLFRCLGQMTKEDVIRMAREARMPYFYQTKQIANLDGLERFAVLVASAEREACAQVCDDMDSMSDYYALRVELICANAIRARGQA